MKGLRLLCFPFLVALFLLGFPLYAFGDNKRKKTDSKNYSLATLGCGFIMALSLVMTALDQTPKGMLWFVPFFLALVGIMLSTINEKEKAGKK